jgi:hypothetical protein
MHSVKMLRKPAFWATYRSVKGALPSFLGLKTCQFYEVDKVTKSHVSFVMWFTLSAGNHLCEASPAAELVSTSLFYQGVVSCRMQLTCADGLSACASSSSACMQMLSPLQ